VLLPPHYSFPFDEINNQSIEAGTENNAERVFEIPITVKRSAGRRGEGQVSVPPRAAEYRRWQDGWKK
jgi:hypothetical protein